MKPFDCFTPETGRSSRPTARNVASAYWIIPATVTLKLCREGWHSAAPEGASKICAGIGRVGTPTSRPRHAPAPFQLRRWTGAGGSSVLCQQATRSTVLHYSELEVLFVRATELPPLSAARAAARELQRSFSSA